MFQIFGKYLAGRSHLNGLRERRFSTGFSLSQRINKPGLSDKMRREIGKAAVRAAKAVGYVGAGTVEFIYDRNDHRFYFMEMNTRLQVEHPVTEAITGLDLVEWQLNIAAGERLPLTQEQISINGHAFEARIYAEDPRGGFLPRAGPLIYLSPPKPSRTIRVETGVREGDEVSVHYDPMIAKLVVWGINRAEALDILRAKLAEYNIAGVETNIEFVKDVCRHPKFQAGEVHTGFIEENLDSLFLKIQPPSAVLAQGVLGLIFCEDLTTLKAALDTRDPFNPFKTEIGMRVNHSLKKRFKLIFMKNEFVVDVKYEHPDVYLMRINDLGPWRKVEGQLTQVDNDLVLKSIVEGIMTKSCICRFDDELHVFTNVIICYQVLIFFKSSTKKRGFANC
uniref:Mccc1_1 protein n=1 Tax=Fopius arisanus TaxID=64838 RepID=A0A0C9QAY5_9HYME